MSWVCRKQMLAWAAALVWPLAAAGVASAAEEDVWAVRCVTLQGPQRFQRANGYADALKKVRGLKPELVQVVSDEESTTVFYGRYKRIYGSEGKADSYKPNHLSDLDMIRNLSTRGTDEAGRPKDVWPFILATMDVLPTYRTSHPEWDLNNADGYWSLHVAVFYNEGEFRSRRTAAEEYCRLLREQGEQAYFHHATEKSSVYVGVYPQGAVSEIRRENPLTGQISIEVKISDPKMLAAQQRFPLSLDNGRKRTDIIRNSRTNEVQNRVPTPSFAVVIPKAQKAREQAAGRPGK